MKIWLHLVNADGDVAATLLRPWRRSYAFVALLYPFYIESEISIRFYYDLGASTALAVSATIRVILTKISHRSRIAVQWNGVEGGGGGGNQDTKGFNEIIWATAWDFQQCGICDQQSLKSACAYGAVWSEPLLVAWVFYDCYNPHSTGRRFCYYLKFWSKRRGSQQKRQERSRSAVEAPRS